LWIKKVGKPLNDDDDDDDDDDDLEDVTKLSRLHCIVRKGKPFTNMGNVMNDL
jgi:hypothetical protein